MGKVKKKPVLRVYETQEQETRDIVDFEIVWKSDTSIRERISASEIRTPRITAQYKRGTIRVLPASLA
jgi:hypothetical protein